MSSPAAHKLSDFGVGIDLPVLAVGMVTPQGPDALRTVIYAESGVAATAPSPYVLREVGSRAPEDQPPVEVALCSWLPVPGKGATREVELTALGDRMIRLARAAAAEALSALLSPKERKNPGGLRTCPPEGQGLPLHLCVPDAGSGLPEEEIERVSRALASAWKSSETHWHRGEAGVFEALEEVGQGISEGAYPRALVVAVDSQISLLALDPLLRCPVSPWAPLALRPSEGAAALLVGRMDSPRESSPPLATLHSAVAIQGQSTDNDDAPLDGNAMTELIRSLPPGAAIQAVFGQESVSLLRARDWEFAASRERERFALEVQSFSVESRLGRLGAAAGAVSLVYAITALRAGVIDVPPRARCAAWAVSPSGLRGLGVLSVRSAEVKS